MSSCRQRGLVRTAGRIDSASAVGVTSVKRDVRPFGGIGTGIGIVDLANAGTAGRGGLAASESAAVAVEKAGSTTVSGVNVASTCRADIDGDIGVGVGTVSLDGRGGTARQNRLATVEDI